MSSMKRAYWWCCAALTASLVTLTVALVHLGSNGGA